MTDYNKLNDFLTYARAQEGPKVSLHLKTHRVHPDNKADPINYKNAVQDLQRQFEEGPHPRRDWEPIIKRMEQLLENQDFWTHTPDGIVVLAAGERMEVFPLQHDVKPMHRLGSHFHMLPLFRLEDSLGDAYLVDLSRDRFSMYLVSPQSLHEVETPEVKQSFPELFDDFDANANLRVGSFGGKDGMHYGHRARPEELEKDREKYFRYLSDSFERLHRDSGMHFILAGTTETVAHFQKIASGQKYLDGTIDKPLDAMDEQDILQQASVIMRPLVDQKLSTLTTEISNAGSANKASHDLGDIAQAAKEGRVGKLVLVDDPRDDQLDTLAAIVDDTLLNGGEVLAVAPQDRPLERDYSAVLRY